MPKPFSTAVVLIASAALCLGSAAAGQTPASHHQASAAQAKGASAGKAQPASAAKSSGAPALKTQKEKASYAIGLNLGRNMRQNSVDVDPNILLLGVKDALAGRKPLLTDDEAKAALAALQNDVHQKAQAKMQEAGARNQKEGEAFLAANKTKSGVVTLPSGLQYKILKEGTGPKPSANDVVVCNYRGTLINNTEFDSSYKRGQPVTFPVGRVIKGWEEALQLMPVGSKWQLFVPPALAYGQNGAAPDIGPNATLIFEVELLSIKGK
jgi:FKBP-type peptidyl-prolyl cis-trans isomerase FklB